MKLNESPEIATIKLEDSKDIPNHPQWPLVHYRGLWSGHGGALADEVEETYRKNQWSGAWRWGVYHWHHYHSNAHEVLTCVEGEADITFGGPNGQRVHFKAGDAVVLPAGTGHKNESASSDFLVVGAYPKGQEPDMCREDECDKQKARERIRETPKPEADPFFGPEGPLCREWSD